MSILYNKMKVVIDLANIQKNYQLLSGRAAKVIAVVKADAYGHGLVPVAQALAKSGVRDFAVGTVEEGAALRVSGLDGTILSLLGPVEDQDYPAMWEYGITPFLHSYEQVDKLAELAPTQAGVLPLALKFDTGMRRLGFTLSDVPALSERLKGLDRVRVAMLSSHLATADEPQSLEYLDYQAKGFRAVAQALTAQGFRFETSLANSSAILAGRDLPTQASRAGIALYGANPFHGTRLAHLGQGLLPAMSVKTLVVSVHALKAGQTISYGRTFQADADMRVAVVAAGYADAYSRGLSSKAGMCLHGQRVRVLGRVCMQLTAVDVTNLPQARVGDEIYLLGGDGPGAVSPEELAEWWGSIPYEAFCLLGLNKREYRNQAQG